MIQPIFAIGVGVTEGQDFLAFARSLFNDFAEDFNDVGEANGLDTTLQDYVDESASVSEVAAKVRESEFGKFILESAINYLTEQGFDTSKHAYVIKNVWLNEMKSGSNHRMHAHNGHEVSGCFYVDLPENSAKIMFEGFLNRFDKKALPIKDYTYFNSDTWTLNMTEGQLACWNSYLRHGVPEQAFEGIRRSIAFDICAIGKH